MADTMECNCYRILPSAKVTILKNEFVKHDFSL